MNRYLSVLSSIVLVQMGFFMLLPYGFAEQRKAPTSSYSPYAGESYPTHVYWGDTHLHTNLSIDASYWGGNRALTPDIAYRFARGEMVQASNGMPARLNRPLDFLVVADHGYNLGVVPDLLSANIRLLETDVGRQLLRNFKNYQSNHDTELNKTINNTLYTEKVYSKKGFRQIWRDVAKRADHYNNPGKFTAFTGYEWTSWGTPRTSYGNLHRVVIYKDTIDKAGQITPLTSLDSINPEDLWRSMANYEKTTGGEVLAIPHNGNVSNGEMFSLTDFNGQPLSSTYATMRQRWEPLYEVTQMKGDGETHPILSPNDEFADYETWNSWAGRNLEGVKTENWIERKRSEHARSALKLGLAQQAKLGVNPFKFGMIGSTDSHTSLATAEENNFWGKVGKSEPSPKRMLEPVAWDARIMNWETAAAGYAAVWAQENSRESLFSAMKRKEVYATTGPRITVRFFGGWDYHINDAFRPDFVQIGYNKGVPMGSDLTKVRKGKSPTFLIRAVRDSDGANLDRIQVIKGWRSQDGELHEKIFNVALSNGRQEKADGKVPSVGSTVDVKDASYINSIGDPELAVVWRDSNFNKDELAFYYVRVLQIPTPRWTAYDAKFFSVENIPPEVPMITQERAYTSPIWYVP